MKIRDISLIVSGAVGAIVVGLFLSTYFNKAEAQSAGAAGTTGANPVIVTSAAPGNGANAGIIVVNNPATKTITAVSYQFTYVTGGASGRCRKAHGLGRLNSLLKMNEPMSL